MKTESEIQAAADLIRAEIHKLRRLGESDTVASVMAKRVMQGHAALSWVLEQPPHHIFQLYLDMITKNNASSEEGS